jgi:hypothetical protein
MQTLNEDPLSYSYDIEWTTISGRDEGIGNLLFLYHLGFNDGLVAEWSAHLSFATSYFVLSISHLGLQNDPHNGETDRPFDIIANHLGPEIDSDGDGLSDIEERFVYFTDEYSFDTDNDNLLDWDEIYVYGTSPILSDSDSDGLSDDDELLVYLTNPLNIDSDYDILSDGDEVLVYGSNPLDSDTDGDGLIDGDEIHIHDTLPTAWSTDGDILSDNQEIEWGYDPNDTDDPIDAQYLTYSTWHVSGIIGRVRANHYTAMDYVKVYVKYKNSLGYWTANFLSGMDDTPGDLYVGDYFVEWSILSGYVQMLVTVKAYDSLGHYLGQDTQYVTLPDDGGGGRPGGDPVPE